MKDGLARFLGGRACATCGGFAQSACAECSTPVCGLCLRDVLDPDGDLGLYRQVCPKHLDLSIPAIRRLMGLKEAVRWEPVDLEAVGDDFLASAGQRGAS